VTGVFEAAGGIKDCGVASWQTSPGGVPNCLDDCPDDSAIG